MTLGRPTKPRGIKRGGPAIERTPLTDWRSRHELSWSELARRIGTDCASVISWAEGRAMPSLVAAYRIELVTKGKVPMLTWLGTLLGAGNYNAMADRAKGT